jgi:uncharacterized protein (TIGR02452 family)
MNHIERQAIAEATVALVEQGVYQYNNVHTVNLQAEIEYCVGHTSHYSPEALLQLPQPQPAGHDTVITVTSETTLQAGQRLVAQYGQVVALNFASAKNPGGGFLRGTEAQEESLARASALYASLKPQTQFYRSHRASGNLLYSHQMIYSPAVPVFRNDSGDLLPDFYLLDIITAAAPNYGAASPASQAQIPAVFAERLRLLLTLLAYQQCQHLILGAWGCGVFRNDPLLVAKLFRDALLGDFAGFFQTVTFAIYDPARGQPVLVAFNSILGVSHDH